jgi:hypothetical protein
MADNDKALTKTADPGTSVNSWNAWLMKVTGLVLPSGAYPRCPSVLKLGKGPVDLRDQDSRPIQYYALRAECQYPKGHEGEHNWSNEDTPVDSGPEIGNHIFEISWRD